MTSRIDTSFNSTASAAAATANAAAGQRSLGRRNGLRLCTAQAKVSKFEATPFKGAGSNKHKPMGSFGEEFPSTVKRSGTILKRYPGYNPYSTTLKDTGAIVGAIEPESATTDRTATYHYKQIYDEKFRFQTLSTGEIQELEDAADYIMMGEDNKQDYRPLKRSQTIQLKIPLNGISKARSSFRLYVEDAVRYLGSFSMADINFCFDLASHGGIVFFSVFGVDVLHNDKTLFCVLIPLVLAGFLKLLVNHQKMNRKLLKEYHSTGEQSTTTAEIRYYSVSNKYKFAFQLHFFVSLFRSVSIFKSQFANRDSKLDNLAILGLGALLVGCLIDLFQQTIPNLVSSQNQEVKCDQRLQMEHETASGSDENSDVNDSWAHEENDSNDSSATLTEDVEYNDDVGLKMKQGFQASVW
ncbi:hypothetical protein WICPIJ_007313 [Wickerhamomyces pijperi]|uniref:Uncharacterized protein n=1 Tax=Wickerhamomyces pijperi TaxID=599730 RepID=A0A9P8TKJ4_WICPI|nr:hypothetical protein WICPIJ_007313 [Wickerhamomyces pijperi]